MRLRRKKVDPASAQHRKLIDVLYPKRKDSQVGPATVYRTNWGRKRA
jgi:hypothetical protein